MRIQNLVAGKVLDALYEIDGFSDWADRLPHPQNASLQNDLAWQIEKVLDAHNVVMLKPATEVEI